jgi:RNA polymerase sigma-54 factor
MAISIQTGLKQTHKLGMTQSLKQAIELLQLSTIELYEKITSELVDNPVLEEESDYVTSPQVGDAGPSDGAVRDLAVDETRLARAEERNLQYDDGSDQGFTNTEDDDRKRYTLENYYAHEESLTEHLLWQARLTARDESEFCIYEAIITSLDENGFLPEDAKELFSACNCGPGDIETALSVIQLFDPVGCAVRNVSESLGVQVAHYYTSDTVLARIINECFELLEKLDYQKISKMLAIPLPGIMEKSKIIQMLDPYPGRQYSNRTIRYIIPDIDVKLVDGEIIVGLNDDWIPGLRVNSYYISLLKKKNIEKKLQDYIQDKMQSARYLMKNIATRRNTILRVAGSIMKRQKEFLEKGPGHLKPLTHGEVAKELNIHESTVSRVTSNKYVQTSWGVFNLKSFFVSRLKSANGSEDSSSDEVMNLIRDIIVREKVSEPYSDESIVRILGKAGVTVARRTVAKYRGILNIPPSNMRKKINKIKPEEHT